MHEWRLALINEPRQQMTRACDVSLPGGARGGGGPMGSEDPHAFAGAPLLIKPPFEDSSDLVDVDPGD